MDISVSTANKYWEMTPQEYKDLVYREHSRYKNRSLCEPYRREILDDLKNNPSISSSEIYRKIEDKLETTPPFSERTLSRFISQMREDYGIRKQKKRKKLDVDLNNI